MGINIKSDRAFKSFFEEFYPPVYSFLTNYSADGELAKDLAQDIFLKVYEKRGEIGEISHAKAFLYTTARRLYLDHCKHSQVEEQYADNHRKDPSDDDAFLHEVTVQETLRILYDAIDRLPPQTQKIVRLHLQEKSNQEIADALNISINTVKSLKKSAYTTLRDILPKDQAFFILLFLL